MTYFNTTHLAETDLKRAIALAETQTDQVLAIFHAKRLLTPSECGKELAQYHHYPLTSIRRAISDLTRAGKLEKTTIKKSGIYGMPEYCWRVVVSG